jgi:hypothetical protein
VVVSASGARARKAARDLLNTPAPIVASPGLHPEDFGLTVDDFLLPTATTNDTTVRYTPFRQRLTKWTPQQVAKYWISPREIATEIVASLNDQNVGRLFEKVP